MHLPTGTLIGSSSSNELRRSRDVNPLLAARYILVLVGACWLVVGGAYAQSPSPAEQPSPRPIQVYFSPRGGCTTAIVNELRSAKTSVLIQAYGFTNKDIAFETVQAKRRGVPVKAILDKSNKTDKYSAADFLVNMGVPVWIDSSHAIAHDKIMIIDSGLVITGSFNFTKAAEERNSENLLVIRNKDLAVEYERHWNEHLAHAAEYVGKQGQSVGASGVTTGSTAEPTVLAISQAKVPEADNAAAKKKRRSRQDLIIRFGYSSDVLMQQITLAGEAMVWVGDPYRDTENDAAKVYPKEPPWGGGMIAVFADQSGVSKAVWLGGDGLYGQFAKDKSLTSRWSGNPSKEREKYLAVQKSGDVPVAEEQR